MYRPRQAVLQQWKRSLQVGDVVNAKDKRENWYEAVITSVQHPSTSTQTTDNKGIKLNDEANKMGLPRLGVHFKGWGKEFDEEISPLDVERKIEVSC